MDTQIAAEIPTATTSDVEGEPSAPPKRYYAASEAICSECGRHVDLCHPHGKVVTEDDWV